MVSLLVVSVAFAAVQPFCDNRQIIVKIIAVNGLMNCAVFFTIFLILYLVFECLLAIGIEFLNYNATN